MSQNSLVLPIIGTVSGLQMTQFTNLALDSLNTLNSGGSSPSSVEAGQLWHDTSSNSIKIRNLANTAWIVLTYLDETANIAYPQYASYNQCGFSNIIRNPIMTVAQRGSSSISVTSSTPAYTLDGFIASCTGAAITAQQSSSNQRTSSITPYSLLLTGASSVTDISLKQRIESFEANKIEGQTVTFQAQIYNNTGGSITPTLTIKHATSSDNWAGTTTDLNAVSLQACTSSAWTKVAYTFAASASSGLGLEVTVDFGNNFSTSSKSVQITEIDMRATPNLPIGQCTTPPIVEARPYPVELEICQRYYAILGAMQGAAATSSTAQAGVQWPTSMRTTPTLSQTSSVTVTFIDYVGGSSTQSSTSITLNNGDNLGGRVSWNNFGGLTSGHPGSISGTSSVFGIAQLSAEL